MAHITAYNGPSIDTALERGRSLRVVNNGWIRLSSSNSIPYDLDTLTNAGNYTVAYWTNGPVTPEIVTPLNVIILNFSGTLYQFADTGTIHYWRSKNGDIFTTWSKDHSASTIYPSPIEPTNPSYHQIWIDTSSAAPELLIYDGTDWVGVGPSGVMSTAIYDTQHRETDIFEYIDEQIAAASLGGTGSVINAHIADTSMHVTVAEKTRWDTSATSADVNTAANNLYGLLQSEVESEVNESIAEIETLASTVNNYQSTLLTHVNTTEIHPNNAQQLVWNAKANADHVHNLDGNVTVDAAHVVGELPAAIIPYEAKERVYQLSTIEEMYALTKGPVHNGDMIYLGDATDSTHSPWYIVVDDTKLGDTSILFSPQETRIPTGYSEAICYGNGIYIIISSSGVYCYYSNNGITWYQSRISNTTRDWKSVCYGNEMFVVLAYNTNIGAYSYDGLEWTEFIISPTARTWCTICYGNGKFVAFAYLSNIFAYSSDGITWTEGTVGDVDRNWLSVCYGNGKFVAIAMSSNIFAYSSDGITWTTTYSTSDKRWCCVCYGNGKFIAIANDDEYFNYSTDGMNWQSMGINADSASFSGICYGNGVFVISVIDASYIFYSNDGLNWNRWDLDIQADSWSKICYGNNAVILTSRYTYAVSMLHILGQYVNAFRMISSGDGLDWNSLENVPNTIEGFGITDAAPIDLVYDIYSEVDSIYESMPSYQNTNAIVATQTSLTDVSAGVELIDSVLTSLDSAILKLESVAQ